MNSSALRKTVVITSVVAVVSLLIAGIIGAVTGVDKTVTSPDFWGSGPGKMGGTPVDQKKSLPLDQTDKIEIKVVSSDVIVSAGEGDSIKLRLHGTVSVPSSDYIPKLVVEQDGNTVRAYTRLRDRTTIQGWRDDTRLEVSVPAKYNGSLAVSSVSGNITPGSHDYKQLTLETVSGDIDGNAARAAGLDLYSVSGDIELNKVTGDVKASSTSGDIELSFVQMPGKVAIENISGDIGLGMPSDAGFTLDARSTSGDVSCDFPITITSSHRGAGQNNLAGRVGDGRGNITVKTVSGDIGITR